MCFSIIIPTWNNLAYLKCCIESIRKNSTYLHEIIVHVNEGTDGTLEWLQENGVNFTHSNENVGICVAMNKAYTLCTLDYILYMNDDMYVLPEWDFHLMEEINTLGDSFFMLSSTMIEPTDSGNKAVIVANYGNDLNSFEESRLLTNFITHLHEDWSGSCWPPNVIPRTLWDAVGGYNKAFSPGMSSDDDLAMRLWKTGCRVFKGLEKSRVYHFQCKSTRRIVKNNGRITFLQLYGITQGVFQKYYLRRGERYVGLLKEPNGFSFTLQKMRCYLKKFLQSL